METLKHKELTKTIISAAYNVHNELGYSFLEKVYKNALAVELNEAGIKCNVEVPMTVGYHDKVVGEYFADIVAENKVIVEIKAVRKLESIHEVQLVNYLKATGLNIGLLINFGKSVEVKRRVLGYGPNEKMTENSI